MAVADIIVSQQTYANDAIVEAALFLDNLYSLAQPSEVIIGGLPDVDYTQRDRTELSKNLLLSLRPVAPLIQDISGILPEYQQTVQIDPIDVIPVPDFDSSPPELDIPQTPDNTLPSAPSAPSISDPVLPTAPTLDLPDAPVLGTVTLPEPPSITLPTFDALPPDDDLVAPTAQFQWAEVEYQSALLDALKAKLLNDLENGTYGLEPSDEDALWNRARDRELELVRIETEAAFKQSAGRGFPLPPGDLNVALQRAHQTVIDKYSSINRDIAIKRNDQYFQARQFTIQESRGLENILINFHSAIMERSLNAAKAALDAGITLFNATVAAFNARYAAYQAQAMVFEAQIRAALSQLELYKTEMEGKKLQVEIESLHIANYKAQLDAVDTIIKLYNSQLEGASIEARIEGTRIDAFRALVEAYRSQVQAKVAEFQMYDAQIKGEVSKVQVYKTEADAYQSIVSGKKTQSDILVARLQSQIAEAGQEIEAFKAKVDGYRADLTGQAATVNARVQGYNADISAYAAATGALAESYRLNSNAQALEDQNINRNKEVAIENARLTFEGLKLAIDTRLGASGHASTFYSALAAGAVNSINALSTLAE